MPNENQELKIPSGAQSNPDAYEVLRIWRTSEEEWVSLRGDPTDCPSTFGHFLAQLVYHGASLHAQRDGASIDVTFAQILHQFQSEIKQDFGVTGELKLEVMDIPFDESLLADDDHRLPADIKADIKASMAEDQRPKWWQFWK